MSFPSYKQLDAMDCGCTCLRIIAKFYGKSYSAKYLRDKSYTTREGVSMLSVSDTAEEIGFKSIGVKLSWFQLEKKVPLPCIIHWNQNHFVVVYKIKNNIVYISDPAMGLVEYTYEEFLRYWFSTNGQNNQKQGSALILEPTPEFYKDNHLDEDKEGFSFLMRYLKPHKQYLFQILLGMLIGSILSLILPFVTQSIVDVGIGTNKLDFVVVMLIAQLVIAFAQTANNFIRSWLTLHVTTRLSISLISDFLSKLMRLPVSFFEKKVIGDILQRIDDYERIQTFLTESFLSIVIAVISFIVYSCIMVGYNSLIMVTFLVGTIFYICWILLFIKRRRKLDYMRFDVAASNQNNLIQLVNGVQDIKMNNCEIQKRWEWETIQAKAYQVQIKSLTLNQTQIIGGTFIEQIKNIIISFLAAKSVIEGDMTLGMMTSVQYIIGQLNAPISQFITFISSYQDARISLERLNEIRNSEDEEPLTTDKIKNIPENADIALKNISFQYGSSHSNKVLKNISLKIPYNKTTAIVGSSGSGKTTLLKLMLGFYHPTEGKVQIGGRDLEKYNMKVWRSNCGAVLQEGFIFSDSIANNIGISDDAPDMDRVRIAVDTANINDLLDSLPLGYETKIGLEGHGLSVGQKQRLLIARAAYKKAKYLFFDEATNSLDANNEHSIMNNLREFYKGKTVVIVAHRLSTVKEADNIVVLDKGTIVEQGTHIQLINARGYYYNLIKNQLELSK